MSVRGIHCVGFGAQFGSIAINPIAAGTLGWNGSTSLAAPLNGTLLLRAQGATPFNIIQLNGTSSSDAGIKRNGTGIDIVRADQNVAGSTPPSGFTDLRAGNITAFGQLASTGPVLFPSTTVAGLTAFPAASNTGGMLFVSDESGGATMAFSDGTNWLRVQDRAIVS